MKKTTLFIVTIATFFIFCSFNIFKPNLNLINGKGKIEVVFTAKTTFDKLAELKNDLHKKHIELTFKKLEFDPEGNLIEIYFSVDCKDGFKGAANSDRLSNNSNFGFFRDYSKNAKSPFGTGVLTLIK